MKDQLIAISLNATWRRIVLLLPVAVVLVGAWYAARWGLANTVAQWAPDVAAAQAAARLAPDDPQAHYTLAELGARSLLPEQLPEAIRQYELAASLSPSDYRLWLKLGRARGLAGHPAGAESAFQRAVELAPGYGDPRWFLGNHLLREGRDEEAFAELQKAAAANPTLYRAQVISVAWRLYDGDLAAVLRAMGNSPSMRAALVEFMLDRRQLDDAVRLWGSLDAAQRQEPGVLRERLLRTLLEAKRFQAALQVQRESGGAAGAELPTLGNLMNGGFEGPVGPPGKSFFDWQVVPVAQAQINLDERQRHGGARSLRVVFNADSSLVFRNVSQAVVVEPSARYRLEFYVRTEDLKSISTPLAEVVDAGNPSNVLAASAPLAQGTRDWQSVTLDFSTGPQTEGVTVRLNRAPCYEPVCPLFGKVWYDDFTLQRIDGSRITRTRAGNDSDSNSRNRAAGVR
ncbi:hypothetical protein BH18ACI2_BH18ACI2_25270 [soil metagenome]